MATTPDSTCWIVVVQTDAYAGNFEREMGAYCTGSIGDCEVGSEQLDDFPSKMLKLSDKMLPVPDDHGCHRPCSIWQAPLSKSYNSVAMFMEKCPTDKELEFIRDRAVDFAKNNQIHGRHQPLKVLGVSLIHYVVSITQQTLKSLPIN